MSQALYPEPPDGSIVGWGHPISTVKVRIDEYATTDERWFDADDDRDAPDPLSWAAVCETQKYAGVPYLLTPTDLTSAPALPSAPAAESATSQGR